MHRIFIYILLLAGIVIIAGPHLHAADTVAQLEKTPPAAEGPITAEQIPMITSTANSSTTPNNTTAATPPPPINANTVLKPKNE